MIIGDNLSLIQVQVKGRGTVGYSSPSELLYLKKL